MNEVTMRKDELTEIVQSNRNEHRAKFEAAVEGYQEEAIRQLNEHITRIRSGRVQEVFVRLEAPEDHSDDYDRVLGMLGHEVSDTVVLDAQSYQRYVMDRWSWTDRFEQTVATYTGRA